MEGFTAKTLSTFYCIVGASLSIAGMIVMFFSLFGVVLICLGVVILLPAFHIGHVMDGEKEAESGIQQPEDTK